MGSPGSFCPAASPPPCSRSWRTPGSIDRLRRTRPGRRAGLATCAGVILLAREVTNPAQALARRPRRHGGQKRLWTSVDSTVAPLDLSEAAGLDIHTIEGVFIRAPRIVRVGPGVEVLARRGTDPVLVRQGAVLAATFHPELSVRSPVIELFVRLLGGER